MLFVFAFRIQAFCISRTPQLSLTTSVDEVEQPILDTQPNDDDEELIRP